MIRRPVVLITGANGEIGHGLITRLAADGSRPIVTLDLSPLDPRLSRLVKRAFTGSILDNGILERILAEFEIDLVFHLAALLSTRSEFTPVTAHSVNVEGTLKLLEFAQREGESHGRPVTFVYPSSIAAYGLPDAAARAKAGAVVEDDWNQPRTMYGCNKLYCEQLGTYYARYYKQLAVDAVSRVDFRAVRFPGLDLGVHGAVGRHVGLRARDDSRGGAGRGVSVLRAARHAHPVHGDAGWRRGAVEARGGAARAPQPHGLQRPRVQPVRRGDPRGGGARVSRRGHHVSDRREAPGHRRFLARGRRRRRRAPRLGLRAANTTSSAPSANTSSRTSASAMPPRTPRTPERPALAGESPLFTGTAVRVIGGRVSCPGGCKGRHHHGTYAGSRDQVGPLRQFGRLLFGGLMGVGALTSLRRAAADVAVPDRTGRHGHHHPQREQRGCRAAGSVRRIRSRRPSRRVAVRGRSDE